ncbi:MAG: DUF4340 domain-containing protein [Parvibaculum sp.]
MTTVMTAGKTAGPLRNLVVLGVVTLVVSLAASVTVSLQEEETAAKHEAQIFFPGLADKVSGATKLVYTTGLGLRGTADITMERGDDGVWRIAEREGYPARGDRVRQSILGLTELEAIEPRTANKEWHSRLGLNAPENLGSGIRIRLYDEAGTELVSLIAGNVIERSTDAQGRGLFYVRRDGEDQTWLARGNISLDKDVPNWLDDGLVTAPIDRIQRVTLWAGSEKPVILSRLSSQHPNYVIENIPDGLVTRGAPLVNASANAFADFKFEDAVPASALEFPNPPIAIIETFDGLKITLTMTGAGSAMWTTVLAEANLDAEGVMDPEAIEAEVADINARLGGWAYKMEQNLGVRLTQTLDELTRPVAAAPAP